MTWTDGQGRQWQVNAGPEAIVLRSGDDVLRFGRSAWERDVQFSALGQQLIVRFYGPEIEAGFLLSAEQAGEFFGRIGVRPSSEAVGEVTPVPVRRREGSTWPKMTHGPVWALLCSAAAFLPVVGLAFGLAAVVLVIVVRTRSSKTTAMAHARVMCAVALVLAVGGMAISLLATYNFVQGSFETLDTVFDRIMTGEFAYSHGAIAASILIVFLSLSIHECGHAITAWWCGDDYAHTLGRVTLNPFAHIDLFGTVILPLLLAITGAPIFGYAKPVPVRLGGIRRYRRAHILISLAGPGANLLLSAVSLGLYLAMGCLLARFAPEAEITGFSSVAPQVVIAGIAGGPVLAGVALVLKLSFMINLFLACFNLVPIPPLDGSWVLEHLFPNTVGRFYAIVRPFGFLIFLALLWTDMFEYLLLPMFAPLLFGYGIVAACTGL